jgi:hypothetical protein
MTTPIRGVAKHHVKGGKKGKERKWKEDRNLKGIKERLTLSSVSESGQVFVRLAIIQTQMKVGVSNLSCYSQ